jgi:serine O-acetyltransferase
MFDNYREDLRRAATLIRRNGASRARTAFVLLASPGVQAVTAYRFAHWLRRQPTALKVLAWPLRATMSQWVRIAWGIEINRAARIGPGLHVGHFGGITVGAHVVAGRGLALSQGVTLGVSGRGERRGSPTIGDHVYIAAGAKLFGRIRVGDNVKIGANAVVHEDVPDNAVVALAPGFRIVSMHGNVPRTDVAPFADTRRRSA